MFEALISRLGKNLSGCNIPYMIIGGQAVLLYGEPRLTRDIDITLGVGVDRLEDISNVVRAVHLEPLRDDIESFVRRTMVFPAVEKSSGIRVDLIFSFTPYEADAIKRARRVKIEGQEVFFAAPEDLIIHKIFAGRPRDLEDVRIVLMKNPDIDREYIRKWLREFDTSTEEEKFLDTFENILKDCK